MTDDPYVTHRVQEAIAAEAAELGIEVIWSGERLVLRGQLDATTCTAVLEVARRAAAPIEVVDEFDHVTLGRHEREFAERIDP